MKSYFHVNFGGKFGYEPVFMTFPGGEEHVRLRTDVNVYEICAVTITVHLGNSAAIMRLLLLTDAVKREYPDIPVLLNMPYIPYARQDRVANRGEPLSIKVFCDLINAQGYHKVIVNDSHSDVALALLSNAHNVGQEVGMFNKFKFLVPAYEREKWGIVAPDAGALKKVYKVSNTQGIDTIFCATKNRDTRTGQVTGTDVNCANFEGRHLLVCDDICDGGRTFVELAKVLKERNCGQLILYVTHGIFSKGKDCLLDYYDDVIFGFDYSEETI